ncbi:MAG: hypothetical protein C4293_04250 [Nitrospiraceae bacterium]
MNDTQPYHEDVILRLLQSSGALTLDQVIDQLPELSWSEVLQAVDALSRRGTIVLRRRRFEYELAYPKVSSPAA